MMKYQLEIVLVLSLVLIIHPEIHYFPQLVLIIRPAIHCFPRFVQKTHSIDQKNQEVSV